MIKAYFFVQETERQDHHHFFSQANDFNKSNRREFNLSQLVEDEKRLQ